jgi:Na+/H+-dicarboxylate symporter
MKRVALHWKIMIGLVLGVAWAILSSVMGWSQFTVDWIKPWGDIFIRILKLIAVPLVLFSIIKGVSSLTDITKLGRLGGKTLGFYLITTVFAVTLGLSLVNTIQPGNKISDEKKAMLQENIEKKIADSGFADKLESKKADAEKMTEGSPLRFVVELFPENIFFSLSNNILMLQVIIFSIFFGIGLTMVPEEYGKPVKSLISGLNEVILTMVQMVMKGAPFFVFALLAGLMADLAGDDMGMMVEIFKGLGWYAMTVLIGLGFLILIFYPTIAKLAARIRYGTFFKGIGEAQMVAFSTSSSAATLPVTMDCVRDNLGVSRQVTSFVLPIGATVNMDGTSLYQAISVVFLAQFFGHDLALSEQLIIVLTATLASIGAPAVPSAGLVMMIIVLESVGLPAAWIALIFPIDRPLDMVRTMVNVTGDATAASVVAKTEGELTPVDA